MSTRKTGFLAVAVTAVAAVAVVVIAGLALGGGDETATRADYQATIVNARDRVDFALERITKSESVDELFLRMDEAVNLIDETAAVVDRSPVAEGFEDENEKLARALRALASEVAGTVATMRDPDFVRALPVINSVSFPQWDAVNVRLGALAEQGIDVQPLARH